MTVRPLLSTAALAAVLLALGSTGAGAHTALTDSSPADGEVLTSPPREVTVTFTEPPLGTGSAMVLQGPQGRLPLAATARGATLSAPWPESASGGAYTVTYRVVAADGHPITGELSFRITSPASNPARSAKSAESATAPTNPPTSAAAPADTDTSDDSGLPVWLWVIGAALLAAGAYLGIAKMKRTG